MLLIRCPYCEEERPELEFRHAGEAHVARPDHIADISDEEFEAFFFHRANPKASPMSAGATPMAAAVSSTPWRDTVSDRFLSTYKAGEKEAGRVGGKGMNKFRLAHAGRLSPARTARFTLRRANAFGPRRRHAGLGTACQRHPSRRPVVQVTTGRAASCRPARRKPNALVGIHRDAASAGRRTSRATVPGTL